MKTCKLKEWYKNNSFSYDHSQTICKQCAMSKSCDYENKDKDKDTKKQVNKLDPRGAEKILQEYRAKEHEKR